MAPGRPAPVSRRERPAKPALTREGIVRTALGIMRSDGLEKTTMRRVAQELDTGPASLYVYVRNTADLHAAMLDELLGEVDLAPATARGPWQERLADILTSYSLVLFANPGLAQSALVSRPSGPNYLNLVEGLLALLKTGQVPGASAAWGVDLLLLVATSVAAEHGTRERAAGAEDEHNALVAAVLGADPARHPEIARLGAALVSGAGLERLAWEFQVLIAGVAAAPEPQSADTPPAHEEP
jgi:AcrR family transcriptional regulator